MKTEIEVKFINVNIDDIRKRLKQADATLEQPMRLMRRVNIEQPEHADAGAWIRIRDEGNKVTMTWKQGMKNSNDAIGRLKELEVVVSDFDDTVDIFRHAGWAPKTYQESKRETWMLGNAEVVIDEWPWLSPMIEIEAGDEQSVHAAAAILGFDWKNANYGNIDDVYLLQYEFDSGIRGVIDVPEVRFGMPLPEVFKERVGGS